MSSVMIFDAKLKEERDYWSKRLVGVGTTMLLDPDCQADLALPAVDAQRVSDGKGERRLQGRLDYRFDPSLNADLDRLTGSSPFLLFVLLVSSLNVCLRRYTDTSEVAIGSPPLAESGQANALVIVNEVKDGERFRDLLLRVRQSLLEA
jgi:hypothetical protein